MPVLPQAPGLARLMALCEIRQRPNLPVKVTEAWAPSTQEEDCEDWNQDS